MTVRVTSVFCDDIRQESNGKLIFIGVYPIDLVPGAMPSTFPMALWLRAEGVGKGDHSFTFKLTGPNGELILEQEDRLNLPEDDKPLVLLFAGFLVSITKTGEIRGTLTLDGQDYEAARLIITAPPA
ncbi:MAG: hypothetical protein DI528_15970 [Shinella sp.]|nr:MAG: hypothetical protein DI528_15970 [Shinella sp.]